jgi:hypothetical protein
MPVRRRKPRRRLTPQEAHARGLALWNSLPVRRRFAIAMRLVRRNIAALRSAYGVPGEPPDQPHIVSVGVGPKLSRPRRARAARARKPGKPDPSLGVLHADQVCIRFIVRSKVDKALLGGDRGPRPIPDSIPARATVRGRRVTVRIPTDIQADSPGRLHALMDATDGVRVVDSLNPANRCIGSFCCVVRNKKAAAERYLLTCRHVLCVALAPTGGLVPTDDGQVSHRVSNAAIADHYDEADLGDGSTTYGCDAALGVMTTPDLPVIWATVPGRVAKPLDVPSGLKVYVPRKQPTSPVRAGPLAATGYELQFDRPIQVQPGLWVRFEAVVTYFAATEPGDSGSALIDDTGALFGMHFYESGQGVSHAIPAYILFKSGLFKIDIRL